MRASTFILQLFIAQIFCLFLADKAFCQTETFDIARYTPPKNWKKETMPGVVILTNVNESKNVFCVIALYASSVSSGKAGDDFTNEWNDLAVGAYGAAADPKTEMQTSPDGWKVVAGGAPVVVDSVNSYLVLTVFSGFGKKMSVLVNFNDESYLNPVDALLQNMKLDKKAAVAKAKPAINSPKPAVNRGNDEAAITNTSSSESFGHMRFVPLKNWKLQKFTNGDIFTPADLDPDQYLEVRIIESKPFTGSLEEAMAISWNDALQQLNCIPTYSQPYDIETKRTSYKGWEYILARGSARKNKEDTYRYDMHLFVIKLNNRIERMIVIGLLNIQNGSFSPYVNPIYQHDVDNLFFNFKFDDWKEPPTPKAGFNKEGLTGMYAGLALKSGAYIG